MVRKQKKIEPLICHTGQHYDEKMSKVFFQDLELPEPDFYLGVGSGSHAEQTAKIMIEFEKILITEKPDLVIVVGDVNSTIACSLTAAKLHIKVAHVEAGLRSFDRTMPEEINRLLTDSISDYLCVTEKSGLEKFDLLKSLNQSIIITDPIGYIDFQALIKNAELIVTDSGGIQEESTYLGVQCITLRNSTERPITVDVGTNQLLGTDLDKAVEAAIDVLNGNKKKGNIPELWDGHAAERIVKILVEELN